MTASRLCRFGPYRLDLDRRRLLRGNELVLVQQKALEILMVLVEHRGEVVSKDKLMQSVWPDAFVEESNLTQNIFLLRKVLGDRPKENRYIATIPGRGYSFVAPLDEIKEVIDIPDLSARDDKQNRTTKFTKLSSYFRPRVWVVAFCSITVLVTGMAVAIPKVVARYLNARGQVDLHEGNINAAIWDYEWSIRMSPRNAAAHYNLADTYELLDDYDRAINEYHRAIDSDPVFYPAYNNLSRLYIVSGRDCAAARRILDRALDSHPNDSSVQYTLQKNYGWAALCLGQLAEAEQHLQRAESIDKKRGAAYCLMGSVLQREARVEGAAPQWKVCGELSDQPEVEKEWRYQAEEFFMNHPQPVQPGWLMNLMRRNLEQRIGPE